MYSARPSRDRGPGVRPDEQGKVAEVWRHLGRKVRTGSLAMEVDDADLGQLRRPRHERVEQDGRRRGGALEIELLARPDAGDRLVRGHDAHDTDTRRVTTVRTCHPPRTGTEWASAVYWVWLRAEAGLDDVGLIDRARAGDIAAYESLVRQYQDVALRTAYLVAPEADAADAVQDAFLKAYAALPRFRRGAPIRPWLLAIVANEARNRRRSADRRAGLALRASAREAGETAPSPEAEVIAGETRRQVHAALGRLRDEDREVLGARFLLDLSEAETAEALAIPAGTVKSRTSRALVRLRAAIEELGEGPAT